MFWSSQTLQFALVTVGPTINLLILPLEQAVVGKNGGSKVLQVLEVVYHKSEGPMLELLVQATNQFFGCRKAKNRIQNRI